MILNYLNIKIDAWNDENAVEYEPDKIDETVIFLSGRKRSLFWGGYFPVSVIDVLAWTKSNSLTYRKLRTVSIESVILSTEIRGQSAFAH